MYLPLISIAPFIDWETCALASNRGEFVVKTKTNISIFSAALFLYSHTVNSSFLVLMP